MDEKRTAGRFAVYGTTLETDFPLRYHLRRSDQEPDVRFFCHRVIEPARCRGTEIYTSLASRESGEPVIRLYTDGPVQTIEYPEIARFDCAHDQIHAFPYAEGLEFLVEICLMGMVMAFWLERRGVPAIHASGVVVDGRAACFMAGTSRGKTTTAASILAAGYPLLSDDIIAIRTVDGQPIAAPAFPQMKLLPQQLEFLGASSAGYERIHPAFEKLMVPIGDGVGRYHDTAVPVGAIFLLDRLEDDTASPSLETVSKGEALMELVRHSFAAELTDAVDRGPGRLGRLATIASAVPFYRLRVPAGYDRLSELPPVIATALRGGRGTR